MPLMLYDMYSINSSKIIKLFNKWMKKKTPNICLKYTWNCIISDNVSGCKSGAPVKIIHMLTLIIILLNCNKNFN